MFAQMCLTAALPLISWLSGLSSQAARLRLTAPQNSVFREISQKQAGLLLPKSESCRGKATLGFRGSRLP